MTGIPPSQPGGPNPGSAPGPAGWLGGFSNVVQRLSDITIAINKLIGIIQNSTPTFTSGLIIAQRVVTAAGAVTMSASDYLIVINKTVPAATTVNLVATPPTGRIVLIKDGGGNASANPITVTPAAGTIDGAATATINSDYACVAYEYNGTEWGATARF